MKDLEGKGFREGFPRNEEFLEGKDSQTKGRIPQGRDSGKRFREWIQRRGGI